MVGPPPFDFITPTAVAALAICVSWVVARWLLSRSAPGAGIPAVRLIGTESFALIGAFLLASQVGHQPPPEATTFVLATVGLGSFVFPQGRFRARWVPAALTAAAFTLTWVVAYGLL